MEHAFAAEDPARAHPVQAAGKQAVGIPNFGAVGMAQTVQDTVGGLDGRRNPGPGLAGARRVPAAGNDGIERCVQSISEAGASLGTGQPLGNVQTVEIQNGAIGRTEPEQGVAVYRPGKDAVPVRPKKRVRRKVVPDTDNFGVSGKTRGNDLQARGNAVKRKTWQKTWHGYTESIMIPNPPAVPKTARTVAAPSRSALGRLLLVSALSVVVSLVPVLSLVLYPLRLFVTFIHEGSHALAAVLTGGQVSSIAVQPDASGVTYALGGWQIVVVMAGYIGAASYGAVMLALARRSGTARFILGLSGAIVALLDVFLVRNGFGFGWALAIAAGLLFASVRLSPKTVEVAAMFLGVQCVVNSLSDLRTLVGLSTLANGPVSDAVLMSQIIPRPPIVWAVLWGVISLGVLGLALRPYWRDARAVLPN